MFDGIERFLFWFSSFGLQTDVDSLCQIDHDVDEETFVTTTGSLLTMFSLIGSQRYMGSTEFDRQSLNLSKALTTLLTAGYGGKQHSVVFGFRSDKAAGAKRLIEMMTPSVNTADRFGADAGWLFRDRLNALAKHVHDEVALFGIMTHRAGMTPSEMKRVSEERGQKMAAMANTGAKLSSFRQMSVMSPPALLMSRHKAAVQTIQNRFADPDIGIMSEVMTCHQVGGILKRFSTAENVDSAWVPKLTSDFRGAIKSTRNGEQTHILMPARLSRQIITEPARSILGDVEISKRGRYYYASLALDSEPRDGNSALDTPSFSALASEIPDNIPWQVHFEVNPNGLEYNRVDKFFAGIFGAAGDHNKSIKKSWDTLKQMKNDGTCVAALRCMFSTWATSEKQVVEQVSIIRSAIESWGNAVVTNETGNPAAAFMGSIPAFSAQMPAEYIPGPIESFARMVPAFRAASIWNEGQIVYHTTDGRPYPVCLGSRRQNFWGTLVFAPTGSGKSFMMNMLNSGALFSPGLVDLPMITVIDKGPSAKQFVELAKAVLPPRLAAQIIYIRPTNNDASFVVNPLDTQLGCDMPLAADKDFLASLLQAIAPNLGEEGGKFVNRVIDVVYDYFSRKSPTARKWEATRNPSITEKLDRVGIKFDPNDPPRIWDIEDAFFKAGMLQEASEVHLHAVPTLMDVNAVLGTDTRIRGEYGEAKTNNGELVIDVFLRNLIAGLNQYKLFSGMSRFKGEERVMVIDTEGLAAGNTSEEGRRIYAVTLLFARRLGARNFFLHEDDIAAITPPLYADYHANRAEKMRSELKFLEYDEIHNAKGIGAVQELLQKDAREGRKYNVVTILSSQQLTDFPRDLVDNSYNFFILGVGTETSARELKETFNLTESETRAVETHCTRPGHLFAMFRTDAGKLSQILHSRPGPIESWAYTTVGQDAPIRDALYKKYGVRKTLQALAAKFPGGSARAAIEKLRMEMTDNYSSDGITAMIVKSVEPHIVAMADSEE